MPPPALPPRRHRHTRRHTVSCTLLRIDLASSFLQQQTDYCDHEQFRGTSQDTSTCLFRHENPYPTLSCFPHTVMAGEYDRRDSQDAILEPEPALVRRHSQAPTESDDELEATELRDVPNRPVSRVITKERPPLHWYDPIRKTWRHNIRISVPHVDCRDHLGKAIKILSVALSYYPLENILRATLIGRVGQEVRRQPKSLLR